MCDSKDRLLHWRILLEVVIFDTSEWFDPRGEQATQLSTFTRSRAGEGDPLGYVQLYRSSSNAGLPTTNEGIYSCIIPEPEPATNPNIVTFYVGIYNTGRGECCINVCTTHVSVDVHMYNNNV